MKFHYCPALDMETTALVPGGPPRVLTVLVDDSALHDPEAHLQAHNVAFDMMSALEALEVLSEPSSGIDDVEAASVVMGGRS
jgi:hypothetical protein